MPKESTNICAGIVLFNPNLNRLQKVTESICNQVKELVLVDNGSDDISGIRDIANNFNNVSLIRNDENEGIAKALNQICAYGFEKGYKWCLTLDHDTVCHENMIEQLLNYQDNSEISIICPKVDYEGVNIKQKNTDSDITDVYACMTSGSLTRLSSWHKIGGFRDSYFIDFVDNEFCMRLRLAGYRIIRVNSCVMHHQLGEATRIKLFNLFPVTISVHKPWRFYYMMRNNLLFILQYRRHLKFFKEIAKLLYIMFNGILYSDKRIETTRYVWRGLKDALRHKEGRMS